MKQSWMRVAVIAAVILIGGVIYSEPWDTEVEPPTVVVNEARIKVEIADTPQKQEQGLSGRTELKAKEGMLFVFPGPDKACFWMKDMVLNIDILWFDEHQRLLHIEENLTPKTYPKSFCPPADAKYVLEVPAGTVDEIGAQQGQLLEIENYKP